MLLEFARGRERDLNEPGKIPIALSGGTFGDIRAN